jgi:uncharacterized surface protein with fasciclin (FAS1) repeats
MKSFLPVPLLFLLFLLTSGSSTVFSQDPSIRKPLADNVFELIAQSENHTVLTSALEASGLDEILKGEGPFTVFAPTDAAFEALPGGFLDSIMADPEGALLNILQYHIAEDYLISAEMQHGQLIPTLNGFYSIVSMDTLENIFIGPSLITTADQIAENGVVHFMDAVLIPVTVPETVWDIISGSEVHILLTEAITAAKVDQILSGEGPFTVFAPTDAAFTALPEQSLDLLFENPEGDLKDILLYHIAEGVFAANMFTSGLIIPSLFGENLTITIDVNDQIFINDAQIILHNLMALNGVVQVIDALLIPVTLDAEMTPSARFFHIYPNPSAGPLWIEGILDHPSGIDIDIFDLHGHKLIHIRLPQQERIFSHKTDIGFLQHGIYLVRVSTSQWIKTEKIKLVKN